jgi:hypothetical protein
MSSNSIINPLGLTDVHHVKDILILARGATKRHLNYWLTPEKIKEEIQRVNLHK